MAYITLSDLNHSEIPLPEKKTSSFDTISTRANAITLTKKCGHLVYVVVIAILVSSLFAYTVSTDSLLPRSLYDVSSQHHLWTQVTVTALASALAFSQTYQVCTVITFTLNQSCGQHSFRLRRLNFWVSLANRQLDWSQHWLRIFILSVWVAITIGLTTIWSGALTPVPSVRAVRSPSFMVARYSEASSHYWTGNYASCDSCWLTIPRPLGNTNQGYFNYNPFAATQGLFIIQAGSATSRTNATQKHAKIDNTGYVYLGRSFGAGASAGLLDNQQARSYQYFESGYSSTVTCSLNASANLGLVSNPSVVVETYRGPLSFWQPTGSLPNGEINANFGTLSLDNDLTVCAVLGSAANDRYMYGFAVGSGHAMFNNVQCEVTFNPARLNVTVNTREKTIQVLMHETSHEYDIDPTGQLKDLIFAQPYIFSAVDTTIVTNIFANAFINNVVNVAVREGLPADVVYQLSSTGNVTDSIRLQGVAEAFESLVDNSLLTMSTAQLMLARDRVNTTATEYFDAYRIGKEDFIYAVTIIELAVVLIYVTMAITTRFWKDLSAFDITDFKNIVTAVTGADAEILRELEEWHGTGDNPLFDKLVIKRNGSTVVRYLSSSYSILRDEGDVLGSVLVHGPEHVPNTTSGWEHELPIPGKRQACIGNLAEASEI